jgi:hypothetical protein
MLAHIKQYLMCIVIEVSSQNSYIPCTEIAALHYRWVPKFVHGRSIIFMRLSRENKRTTVDWATDLLIGQVQLKLPSLLLLAR